MKTYLVAIVGLGRMGSTIDEGVVDYPVVTLPYSIAASASYRWLSYSASTRY